MCRFRFRNCLAQSDGLMRAETRRRTHFGTTTQSHGEQERGHPSVKLSAKYKRTTNGYFDKPDASRQILKDSLYIYILRIHEQTPFMRAGSSSWYAQTPKQKLAKIVNKCATIMTHLRPSCCRHRCWAESRC